LNGGGLKASLAAFLLKENGVCNAYVSRPWHSNFSWMYFVSFLSRFIFSPTFKSIKLSFLLPLIHVFCIYLFIMNTIFSDVTPINLVQVHRCFRWTYCFCLESWRIRHRSNLQDLRGQ
jgi:predicted membrane channel-forming protein YqfA (hemolysin III family)